jgi:methyl-accepting chemotaxis protein
MRQRFTIGQKLSASFGVVFALTALLMFSSVETGRQLGGLLDREVNENAKSADLTAAIRLRLREMNDFSTSTQFAYAVSKVLQVNSSGSHNARELGDCAVCHQLSSSAESRENFAKLAQDAAAKVEQLAPLIHGEQAQASLGVIRAGIAEWQSDYEQYLQLTAKDDFATAHALIKDTIAPLMDKIDAAANQLDSEQGKLRASSQVTAARNVARSNWITVLLLVLSLICGVALALVIRQINRLLRQFASELKEGAETVSQQAEQVREASRALGQGAADQAASIEQTSASSEEVVATAHQNAEHSAKASQLVQNVRQEMTKTNVALEQTMQAMHEIGESSEKISKIIKVIDEIAFQTNLLALNAAVEAARAGEAGMGFAVVADEVRGLAQRCATAAHDTASLIEESIGRSQQGKARLDDLTSHIRAIADGTEAVTALAEQVQVGSQEQERAMQEIGTAIVRMRSVSEKAAANAEQSAETGERLSKESSSLRGIVDGLHALVDGGDGGSEDGAR